MFTEKELYDFTALIKEAFETNINMYLVYKESDNKDLMDSVPEMILSNFKFCRLFENDLRQSFENYQDLENLNEDFESLIYRIKQFDYIENYFTQTDN